MFTYSGWTTVNFNDRRGFELGNEEATFTIHVNDDSSINGTLSYQPKMRRGAIGIGLSLIDFVGETFDGRMVKPGYVRIDHVSFEDGETIKFLTDTLTVAHHGHDEAPSKLFRYHLIGSKFEIQSLTDGDPPKIKVELETSHQYGDSSIKLSSLQGNSPLNMITSASQNVTSLLILESKMPISPAEADKKLMGVLTSLSLALRHRVGWVACEQIDSDGSTVATRFIGTQLPAYEITRDTIHWAEFCNYLDSSFDHISTLSNERSDCLHRSTYIALLADEHDVRNISFALMFQSLECILGVFFDDKQITDHCIRSAIDKPKTKTKTKMLVQKLLAQFRVLEPAIDGDLLESRTVFIKSKLHEACGYSFFERLKGFISSLEIDIDMDLVKEIADLRNPVAHTGDLESFETKKGQGIDEVYRVGGNTKILLNLCLFKLVGYKNIPKPWEYYHFEQG